MPLIINDTHIGTNRVGGTTPASQQALREYLRDNLRSLLHMTNEKHVIVNGDLFNAFSVDISEVLATYEIFSEWLSPGRRLTLVCGNHDANPRGDKVSSFHTLCFFLRAHFGEQVTVCDTGFEKVCDGIFVIPHCANQDVFDLEIEKAVASPETGYLLLHANFKNGFAENSDHSLNVNDEQVGKLMVAGWNVAQAHEHVGYTLRSERVIVIGNQRPSSCADCIGDPDKQALVINDGKHRFIETWRADDNFAELDWRDLSDGGHKFIRVVGDATAEQAADVVNAIAKFRQASSAMVISNAVRIEGQELLAEMGVDSVEAIKKFDVTGAIFSRLTEREIEVVKELLEC